MDGDLSQPASTPPFSDEPPGSTSLARPDERPASLEFVREYPDRLEARFPVDVASAKHYFGIAALLVSAALIAMIWMFEMLLVGAVLAVIPLFLGVAELTKQKRLVLSRERWVARTLFLGYSIKTRSGTIDDEFVVRHDYELGEVFLGAPARREELYLNVDPQTNERVVQRIELFLKDSRPIPRSDGTDGTPG